VVRNSATPIRRIRDAGDMGSRDTLSISIIKDIKLKGAGGNKESEDGRESVSFTYSSFSHRGVHVAKGNTSLR
jgi:hypothetical protein